MKDISFCSGHKKFLENKRFTAGIQAAITNNVLVSHGHFKDLKKIKRGE